jgi:hypothetical protein
MGDSVESRKALETKMREIEDLRATNSRLEREVFGLKSSVDREIGTLFSLFPPLFSLLLFPPHLIIC